MLTDETGTAVLDVDPYVSYTVTVAKERYSTASGDTQVIQPGEEVELLFQLQPNKGRIRVRVVDSRTGAPISGAQVTVTPKV